MKLFISQSGVASTLLRNFSDTIGVDFKNLPLANLAYMRLEALNKDRTKLVLFPQTTNPPAHSIPQLDFAGLSEKLGETDLRGDLFYFQELKDLLRAILDVDSIYVVHNSEVYYYGR